MIELPNGKLKEFILHKLSNTMEMKMQLNVTKSCNPPNTSPLGGAGRG